MFVYELSDCGFGSRCCHLNFKYDACFEQEVPGHSGWIECRFNLKLVRNMIITYRQIHRTDKYSQHRSIIWPVWLNGWVFVYELSGRAFESRFCHQSIKLLYKSMDWILHDRDLRQERDEGCRFTNGTYGIFFVLNKWYLPLIRTFLKKNWNDIRKKQN